MKKKINKFLLEMVVLTIGLILLGFGVSLFLIPMKIVSGGITGLSIIIYYVFKFPVGMTMLIINLPLLIVGIIILGKNHSIKTVYGIFGLSIAIDTINYLFKDIAITDNMLLAAIYSGILCGAGLGLIMRVGGSTGGTVTIAQIITKQFKIPSGYALMITDFLVLIIASFIFGIEPVLYSIITIFVTGKVINVCMQGLNNSKLFFVISDEHKNISELMNEKSISGGTTFDAKGMYQKDNKNVIISVIRNSEAPKLRKLINEIDSKAFVIISDAYEVMGEGFSYPRI